MKILMIFDTIGNICLLAHVLDRQQWSGHQDSAQIQVSRWELRNHTTAPPIQISKSHRAHRNNKQEWEFIFIELQSNLSPCVHWLKIAFWLVYANNLFTQPAPSSNMQKDDWILNWLGRWEWFPRSWKVWDFFQAALYIYRGRCATLDTLFHQLIWDTVPCIDQFK